MSTPEETLCFTCSQPLGDPPRLNHLPSGQVCPCCADRLLDTLPSLLPSTAVEREAAPEPELERQPELARMPRRLPPAAETDLSPGA